MKAYEARARAMNATEQRMYLLDHGWTRGRNQSDWRHPGHPGSHSLAAAIRLALREEGR